MAMEAPEVTFTLLFYRYLQELCLLKAGTHVRKTSEKTYRKRIENIQVYYLTKQKQRDKSGKQSLLIKIKRKIQVQSKDKTISGGLYFKLIINQDKVNTFEQSDYRMRSNASNKC